MEQIRVKRRDYSVFNFFQPNRNVLTLKSTLAWVFLLDSAFTIFHGVTPKLALRELGFGLVSPESCFHAQSAEECREAWMAWNNRVPSVRPYQTVYELIIAFCKPILSEDDVNWCAHQGFMNLWIVASGKVSRCMTSFLLTIPFSISCDVVSFGTSFRSS